MKNALDRNRANGGETVKDYFWLGENAEVEDDPPEVNYYFWLGEEGKPQEKIILDSDKALLWNPGELDAYRHQQDYAMQGIGNHYTGLAPRGWVWH